MQNIDDKFGQKSKQSKKWYHKIGVVYQNPDYQLFMPTVEKEIKFGAMSDEYADEIAEKFGIKHLYAITRSRFPRGRNAEFLLRRWSRQIPKC